MILLGTHEGMGTREREVKFPRQKPNGLPSWSQPSPSHIFEQKIIYMGFVRLMMSHVTYMIEGVGRGLKKKKRLWTFVAHRQNKGQWEKQISNILRFFSCIAMYGRTRRGGFGTFCGFCCTSIKQGVWGIFGCGTAVKQAYLEFEMMMSRRCFKYLEMRDRSCREPRTLALSLSHFNICVAEDV